MQSYVSGVLAALILIYSGVLAQASTESIHPCHLKGISDRVQCGHLTVPVSPTDLGAKLDIQFSILPAIKDNYPDEAVLVIAGGPGQSAIASGHYFSRLLSAVRQQRDILIIDQRGTGQSSLLQCELAVGADPLMVLDSGVDIKTETQACKDTLNTDLNDFTSTAALQDFEAVRKYLGYKKLHLFGVSYGTRMVQLYMKHYPEAVATATMDGVVPMEQNVIAVGNSVSRALALLFDQCEQQAQCEEQYPNLRDDYQQLDASLAQTLIQAVKHPVSAQGSTLRLNRSKFYGILRFALYSPQTRVLLPYAIAQLSLGDSQPALGLMSLGLQANDLAMGMHAAIVCAEDWPRLSANDRAKISSSPIGREMIAGLDIACPIWNLQAVSQDFSEPIRSDIPSLLLSGYYDPATPPAWGEMVAKNLSNARHIVAPYATHGVAAQTCAHQLIAELIDGVLPKDLDDTCISKGVERRFFINANGATDLIEPAAEDKIND